jgi:hypothetical protein
MPGFADSNAPKRRNALDALLRRMRGSSATAASDAAHYGTVEGAQAALGVAAFEVQRAADLLDAIHKALPEPPDIADRQEGRLPYDRATDILATIECVLEDNLRPAVETLRRSAQVTDAELQREYRVWLKREVLS